MPPKAKTEDKPVDDQTTSPDKTTTPDETPVVQAVTTPTTPAADVDAIAHEVITGRWGTYDGLRDRLTEAGHDATAVFTKVNERLSRGAPSAYSPTPFDLAEQVQNGEWGPEKGLKQRLAAAGFASPTAFSALKKQ